MAQREVCLFEERQGWGRPRLGAVVLGLLGLGMVVMGAVGVRWSWGWGAVGVLGGVMVGAAVCAQAGLVVKVGGGRVAIWAGPGKGLEVGMGSVAGWEVCAVLPRTKIGSVGDGRVFLMGSLSAIEIKMKDGRAVLVGTRRVKEFLGALEKARESGQSPVVNGQLSGAVVGVEGAAVGNG